MGRIPVRTDIYYCIVLMMLAVLSACSGAGQTTGRTSLTWHSFEEGIERAREHGRYVFVNVHAPWCGWCHKMKEDVYTDSRIVSYLHEAFECVHLNYDDTESTYKYGGQVLTAHRLAQKLKVTGVPSLVILDSNGRYLLHLSGFIEASRLLPVLQYVVSGTYERQSFETFLE